MSDTRLRFVDLEPVGPGTPTGTYLRKFWQPVARVRDLRPERARPVEILGEKFTVYLGKDGSPHVVGFRCSHRGAQLHLGWVEGNDIRCRYHGWKFAASGACLEQPNEDRPFTERVTIPTYPVREYLGLIFAYLGEGAPPAFPLYPDFDQDGIIVTDPIEFVPCGFWNRLDNDLAHIPWAHRATGIRKKRMDFLDLRLEKVQETPYGYISMSPVRGAAVSFRNTAHFFMPNVYQFYVRTRARGFENRNLGDTKITWTVPVNDKKFAAFDVTYTPLEGEEAKRYEASRLEQQEEEAKIRWDLAEKVLEGEMSLEDLPEEMSAYTSFAIEDYTTQVGQGSIADRGREHLGHTDVKPMMLRGLWLREVSALVDGRPLTDWKIPTAPLVPPMGAPLDVAVGA